MKFIALNYSSLTYFNAASPCSQFTGSSKYKMVGGELYEPEKQPYKTDSAGDKLGKNKIENTCAKVDYLQYLLTADLAFDLKMKIKARLFELGFDHKNNRYITPVREKKTLKKLNKSKLRGKMSALFNLKCSRKFIAFFSVSFPAGITDDIAFECWNSWLTALRKRFALSNYVWVVERQENGTIHYHMLSNNRMPIKSINKAMATIIDNQVKKGTMSWGVPKLYKKIEVINGISTTTEIMSNPCAENYNGVDVDSIYNSKRHKNTGAFLKPEQIRAWVQKYLTKYVSKNNESFSHLCWHCSHSISRLFTSMIFNEIEGHEYIRKLPQTDDFYHVIAGDYFETHIFLFVPPNWLYKSLQEINDYIFTGFEPRIIYKSNKITIKKKSA